ARTTRRLTRTTRSRATLSRTTRSATTRTTATGAARSTRSSGTTTATATGAARAAASTRSAGAARTTTAAGAVKPAPAATLSVLFFQFCGQGHQFFLGHDAVLVGVGPVEEGMQPFVRHLILGQFAVLVLVERHHPGDD